MLVVTPPMRGWTYSQAVLARAEYGYPAHAGMDQSILIPVEQLARLPRPCGDGPEGWESDFVIIEVTPPMRGWTGYG